jgi:ketosteroid isomerase-like protein
MALSGIEKLNMWQKAFSTGDTSEVSNMLADDYVFEKYRRKQ